MPRFVLFDIDGTLVDSVDLHAQAWQETFRFFGKEIPFDDVRRQIGKGADQLLPVFWARQELEQLDEALRDFRAKLFQREYLPRVRAFPKVRELFERIKEDGKRIGLASSAKGKELEALKKIANIGELVDGETSADDAEKSKPHPDIFEAALARLGSPDPREAIAVGDTPYDAEAAGKVNLRTVGVLGGGFPPADLHRAGCIALYRDPEEIFVYYDETPLAG